MNGVDKRHFDYYKLLRNSKEVHESWEQLATCISLENSEKEFIIDELVIE
jgi:hypothetical protein